MDKEMFQPLEPVFCLSRQLIYFQLSGEGGQAAAQGVRHFLFSFRGAAVFGQGVGNKISLHFF